MDGLKPEEHRRKPVGKAELRQEIEQLQRDMDISKIGCYLGIDVQIARGCAYFVLDLNLREIYSGWLIGSTSEQLSQFGREIQSLEDKGFGKVAIGIDSPRCPLTAPREWFWQGGAWHKGRAGSKGHGRHCEVVLKALNVANPQWTPLEEESPKWMKLGFSLFEFLEKHDCVFEVFPTASYRLLRDQREPKVSISFAQFWHGRKDMLDACISAMTVHEFVANRGSAVGGGDGLGTIILPGKLHVPASHLDVLRWPTQDRV